MKKSFVKKKCCPNSSTFQPHGISDIHGYRIPTVNPKILITPIGLGLRKKNRSFESLVLCLGGIVALVIWSLSTFFLAGFWSKWRSDRLDDLFPLSVSLSISRGSLQFGEMCLDLWFCTWIYIPNRVWASWRNVTRGKNMPLVHLRW